MENLINWFEIPATDFGSAGTCCKALLGLEIKETDMFGAQIGLLPPDRKVTVPKIQISPEIGYFGIVIDTEGGYNGRLFNSIKG